MRGRALRDLSSARSRLRPAAKAPPSGTTRRDRAREWSPVIHAVEEQGAERMWKSLSGRAVLDIVHEVRSLLVDPGRIIHVGTDSKHRGFHTDFVTVIVVLDPGQGGRVFYRHERANRMRSLSQKLFRETELSVATAASLHEAIAWRIVVHVDANEDQRHRSSKYVQALAGMVLGYGFEVQVKPDSWCATHVADYVVNEKHMRVA
jgi:hypothetical protein